MSTPIFRHLLKSIIALQYVVLFILHHIIVLLQSASNYFLFIIKYNLLRQINKGWIFDKIANNILLSDKIGSIKGN